MTRELMDIARNNEAAPGDRITALVKVVDALGAALATALETLESLTSEPESSDDL